MSRTPRLRRSLTTFCQNLALGVLDPDPQGVFAALQIHPDRQIRDLGGDHPVVFDAQPQPVDIQDRVDLDRPGETARP